MKRREEVLARFVEAKPEVGSLEEAAEAMDMTLAALEKALERARAAGDQRGIYAPLRIHRPRSRRARREAILQAWTALPSPKPTHAEAAVVIGCTKYALASAISRARREGSLVETEGPHEAILEDWADLRDLADEHWERAATRLGLTRARFAAILAEARRAGDPRGHLTTFDARHQEAS